MIFNCIHCGISISTKKMHCPYCKTDNAEIINMFTDRRQAGLQKESAITHEKLKGTILSFVLR